MAASEYKYVVVSEYSGEQGHLGGGDWRKHGEFIGAGLAFKWIDEHQRELDYRDVRVEVWRKEK